jgi:hypothetical protein
MMSMTATFGYTEIKNPFAFLGKGYYDSVWFEIEPDKIGVWDDICDNWPRWTFCVQTRKEALETIKQMTLDGWELLSTTESKLESLVMKS